jgi:nucleotide-binding universal stress UspA family protein
MIQPVSKNGSSKQSTVKTILLHIHDDKSLGDRVQAALSIARATSAYVDCLHITPVQPYIAWGRVSGVFDGIAIIETLEKEAVQLEGIVESLLRSEDVCWTYQKAIGDVASEIAAYSSLADLIVTGRETSRSEYGSAISLLGDVIQWSRTPVFVPAQDEPGFDVTGTAMLAWNGSIEAANAIRSSLGLLKLASKVHVLQIEEQNDKTKQFPGTQLLQYLSRQGIHAELIVEQCGKRLEDEDFIAATLMAHARSRNAYIVMGGYSHSRIGEFIFGGVTRTMLSHSSVPLVIAH